MPHKIFEAELKSFAENVDLKTLGNKKGVTRIDTVAMTEYLAMESKPKIYPAVISTIRTDRGKDAMIPQGVLTENFVKNPVLQLYHNGNMVPIGKILALLVAKDTVEMLFHFDEKDENDGMTTLAQDIQRAYDKGLMRAFSIGFLYKSIIWRSDLITEEGTAKETIDIPLPDGSTIKNFKISDFGELPYIIATSWELVEVSVVNIGMNAEALLKNAKDGLGLIKRKTMDTVAVGFKSFVEGEFDEESEELQELIAKFQEKWCDQPVKPSRIVKNHSVPVAEEQWDEDEAYAKLLGWASEDGSGDKDKVDWHKFSKGFLYFEPETMGNITSFLFPHHSIENDELVLSKQGLIDSTLTLLRSDLEKEEKEQGFAHLSKHFSDLGKDISIYKGVYKDEDLEKIAHIFDEKGTEKGKKEGDSEADNGENEVKLGKINDILKRFDALEQQIKEGLIGLRCKINVLTQRFEDYVAEGELEGDSDLIPGEEVDEKVYSSLVKTIEGFGTNNNQ